MTSKVYKKNTFTDRDNVIFKFINVRTFYNC